MGEDVKKLQEHIGDLFRQGEIHFNAGKLKETVEFYQEAYNTARKLNNDKIESVCAFNLGAALIAIQDAENGLNYLFKAKTPIREDSSSNGDLYYNLGLAYEILQKTTIALEHFKDAYLEFKNHEIEKHDMKIACLEKCFGIYVKQKDNKNVVETCKLLIEVYGKEDALKRIKYLCEMARYVSYGKKSVYEEKKAMTKDIAVECMSLLETETEQEKTRNEAVQYMNEIALILTQIQEYDSAWECLKKADSLLSGSQDVQLLALVKQNLGAALNLRRDYGNALKIHEEAIKLYAKLKLRSGQGQCFINLAYAQSQLGTLEGMHHAEIAYHHALQAAKDSYDKHMTFQALEGLGDICYNQGNLEGSEKHFLDALKLVGDNEVASERISQKLKVTLTWSISSNKMFRPTMINFPVNGRSTLNITPRHTSKMQPGSIESKIIPSIVAPENTQSASVTLSPAMPKHRLVPMQKVNSIGPHFPKRAHGLGTIGTESSYTSPQSCLLEAKDESTEESSDFITDEETDSDEDDNESSDDSDSETARPSNAQESYMSETVEQIFQQPTVPRKQLSETRLTTCDPLDAGLKQYEEVLREEAANEEDFSCQDLEKYHSNNDNEDDDDEDEDSSENDFSKETRPVFSQHKAHQKHIQRPQSPQTVSTSVPIPVLANVVVKPGHDKAADMSAQLHRSIHDPIGEEDEESESDSYSDSDLSNNNERDDEQPTYASIDTASKQSHPQAMNGHGNENLDTNDDEIEDHDQEPDIQKSSHLGRHSHHQAGESEKPPDLPQRTDQNKCKSCTVM